MELSHAFGRLDRYRHGLFGIWSHNASPFLPDGTLDNEEQTRRANTFVDLRLIGSDAERAGYLLDMSWHPLFVYDQPPDHPDLEEKGSAQEFVGTRILGGLLKNDEFSLCDCHSLRLE